jgi:hypothetical protein
MSATEGVLLGNGSEKTCKKYGTIEDGDFHGVRPRLYYGKFQGRSVLLSEVGRVQVKKS